MIHSKRKWTLIAVVLGATVIGLTILALWLMRQPGRKQLRATMNSLQMGLRIALYADRHEVPPYSSQGSVKEYLEDLAQGIGESDLGWLERTGKHIVYVNLDHDEWNAVRSFFESHRSLSGKFRTSDPEEVVLVTGWAARYVSSPRRPMHDPSVMVISGASLPCGREQFRAELLHLDRALRESLGKSLTDCVVYEGRDFDPSLLEASDGSP